MRLLHPHLDGVHCIWMALEFLGVTGLDLDGLMAELHLVLELA